MRYIIAYPFFSFAALFLWVACSVSGFDPKETLRGWADRLEEDLP